MSAVELDLDWPAFSAPALCAETDPDAFYPEKGGSPNAAKKVCGRCPAQVECLEYALDRHLVSGWDGIWGGTSPRERQAMLRERTGTDPRQRASIAECGTPSGYKAHGKRGEQACDACADAYREYNREYQYRSGRRRRPLPDEPPAAPAPSAIPESEPEDGPVLIGPVLALVPAPEPEPEVLAPPAAAAKPVRPWTSSELAAAAAQLREIGMPVNEIATALEVPTARVRSALRKRGAR